MLPLIAKKLVSMQMDYVPRLKAPPVVTPMEEKMEVVKGFKMPEPSLLKMTLRGKCSIYSFISTDFLAFTSLLSLKLVSSLIKTYIVLTLSSVTIVNNFI
jgi:hypothetical protein